MRILLVDDDETLMETLAERLIQQRYAVDIAIDGGSASAYVDAFDYDLVVLDLMLPDGDGIEFAQQFRQEGYANPLMILTAKGSTAEKVRALDAGADDYVVKPFDFDELCARIRALLRRENQGLPTVLAWGPLRLDPSACETTYKNHPIRLTPKEFSMMELFLRHPHRVYSLGAIIDDLWSFEDPPSEDAVRTHIKGLRRKLGAAGAPKDLIKTVYGLGYRLNENTAWPTESSSGPRAKNTQQPVPKKTASKPAGKPARGPEKSLPLEKPLLQQGNLPPSPGKSLAAANGKLGRWVRSTDAFSEAERAKIDQAALKGKLAEACRRYLRSASAQIETLEGLTAVLARCDAPRDLDIDLFQQGLVCAHQLAGSLGSFGFTKGSKIAHQLEVSLQTLSLQSVPSAPKAVVAEMTAQVQALRQRINQATVQSSTDVLTRSVQGGMPVLLIVSDDAELVEQLSAIAPDAYLQTQTAANFNQASALLDATACDLVLIDAASDSSAEYSRTVADFIQSIKETYGLPMIMLTAKPDLKRRLSLIESGVDIVSDRSSPPLQIVLAAAGLIKAEVSQVQVAIADDDPEMLTLFKASLSPWGFQVTTFESGVELWHWLTSTPHPTVDLLVLDIAMPILSGLELCRVIRADTRFQRIPILFLTHHQEAALRTQAYEAGGDDYIPKAAVASELAIRLRNQLARACFI